MYLQNQILADRMPFNNNIDSHHVEKSFLFKWPGSDEKILDQVIAFKQVP